jgi:hypothetical protein
MNKKIWLNKQIFKKSKKMDGLKLRALKFKRKKQNKIKLKQNRYKIKLKKYFNKIRII